MKSRTGSLEMIKKINRQLVLETIKSQQPISRARIARELSLSKTTVSAICDELLRSRMVIDLGEKGPEKGSGRPSKMMGFNPLSACGVGIDIHPDHALAVVTDLDGRVLYRTETAMDPSPESMAALARKCVEKAGMTQEKTIGLGVSLPGTVDRRGRVIRANSLGWQDYPLAEELGRLLPFPVEINNEANCAALGERWKGTGARADDLCYIAIGQGVGSAIICDGELIYGAACRAGEIGYLLGEIDQEMSNRNVLGEPGVMERKIWSTLTSCGLNLEQMFQAYVQGKEPARGAVTYFIRDLARVIANIASMLNPEVVVIGGIVAQYMKPVLPDIRAVVGVLTPIPTRVELGSLGPWAAAMGAAFQGSVHSKL